MGVFGPVKERTFDIIMTTRTGGGTQGRICKGFASAQGLGGREVEFGRMYVAGCLEKAHFGRRRGVVAHRTGDNDISYTQILSKAADSVVML